MKKLQIFALLARRRVAPEPAKTETCNFIDSNRTINQRLQFLPFLRLGPIASNDRGEFVANSPHERSRASQTAL
jgi:hypothetical protein